MKIVKAFFLLLLLAVILLGILYGVFLFNPALEKKILANSHLAFLKDLPRPKVVTEFVSQVKKFVSKRTPKKKAALEKMVTLYLKNGNAISGQLLSEKGGRYSILWENGEVSFSESEVDHVERQKVLQESGGIQLNFQESVQPEKWPYQNEVVAQLTNGEFLDSVISRVTNNIVTFRQAVEGGGAIEQDIDRSKIESLLFKPVDNPESTRIEQNLKKQFPKMKFYPEGNFTIVTDSYVTWVKEYKKVLRQNYIDIYLHFFKLFKDRKQSVQNYVVIFDRYTNFVEYAVADGVPGWMVLGYFKPEDQVLYLYNALGDQFSDMIQEAIVGRAGRAIDQVVDQAKKEFGTRYSVFIEGQAQAVKDKYWRAHDVIRGESRRTTLSTLKHESTHAIFHLWGLQMVVVSKPEKNQAELVEKKKQFLEAKDSVTKRRLLMQLIAMRKEEKPPEMEAFNSWFVEGIATFCETNPPGEPNDRWLYLFQQMMKKGTVYPLEQLTVYKMGSFPGVFPEAMLDAYAESWAFVTFLMHQYPDQFLSYLLRVSKQAPKGEEDLQWLLEALGKNSKTLEAELVHFMSQYELLEDPDLKRFTTMKDIFKSF